MITYSTGRQARQRVTLGQVAYYTSWPMAAQPTAQEVTTGGFVDQGQNPVLEVGPLPPARDVPIPPAGTGQMPALPREAAAPVTTPEAGAEMPSLAEVSSPPIAELIVAGVVAIIAGTLA